MQPCPAEETILAFVEDRLRPAERASTEAHLAACESCSSLLAAVTKAWFSEGKLKSDSEPKSPVFERGQRIGPYVIDARIGSGGMGDVYRAHDTRLGRDVALKTLPARFATDPDRLARFRQEARAAGALSHPNVLTIFDVGTHEGAPYLVTELLEGVTLRERLSAGALPPELVKRLGIELARGLAAAHDKGIIHRDLKPANIFLCEGGGCKILDFGLAKLAEALGEGEATQPGVLLGTAGYMAPEQVRGLAVDHRADIFALGAVLYEMAAGRPVFGGSTAVDRMSATLRDEPPPVAGDTGLAIARCLAKDPGARFRSAHDLAFYLESLTTSEEDIRSDAARLRGSPRGLSGWNREPSQASGATAAPARRRAREAIAALAIAVAAFAVAFFVARRSPSPAVAATEPPTYRPLTFHKGVLLSARFSADGHTVVYGAAWDGKPAELFTTRVERPGQSSLGVAADVLAASPKGELALLLEPAFFDSDHSTGTLARMPFQGGAPRAVLDAVQDADWDPRGADLAVVRKVTGRYRIEYPVGTVRFETEGGIRHARVSPVNEQIAFIYHPNPKDDRGAIMVQGGGREPRELSGGWASVRGLAWDPGGEEVWFTASKTDADYALFAVDLAGRERLVDRVVGRIVLQDIAPDGRALIDHQALRVGLSFGQMNGRAEAEAAGEGAAREERELTLSDSSFLMDMTPDGRAVVFAETGVSEGPSYGTYLRPTDGAPAVRLGDGLPLAISPDGKWVFMMKYGEDRVSLFLTPTGPGQPKPLDMAPLSVVLMARWFPDGKRLLVRGMEAGRTARLWTYALDTGVLRPITPEGVEPAFAVSPDSARLGAIGDDGALRLFSVEGDEIAVVPGSFQGQSAVAWDKSGAAVYLRSRSLPVQLTKVDIATGAAKPHVTLPARSGWAGLVSVMTLSLTPDGRSYAYTYSEVLSRLYLAEGLPRRQD